MPKLSAKKLVLAARKIELALMDVDGVLTDGNICHFVDTSGELVEFKGMHSQDSISLTWLAECGVRTGFISGRMSAGTEKRLKMLKAGYIYQGRLDKLAVLDEIRAQSGIALERTLYIGDDLPDLPIISRVGLGIAVSDARPEVKSAAKWVTKSPGGRGAVREVAELVLKSKGLWNDILGRFVDTRAMLR
ncbi:MAG: KdsC family phosphatase [Elusimicrobiota bacterium]